MIPRLKADFGWEELWASFQLTPRQTAVRQFEEAFAGMMEQRRALAFAYGRSALMTLIEALGIRDAEILCPSYTCVVVAHAIVRTGNVPVFVDCVAHDYNLDFEALEDAVTNKTAAVIATSLFGHPIDLDKLSDFGARHPGVQVIQDCAHSFGARHGDKLVNKAGIAAIYGLNISKIISSIYGGMVTTDDEDLAAKIEARRRQTTSLPTVAKDVWRQLFFLATYPSFARPVYGLVNKLERLGALGQITRYYDENTVTMPSDARDAMSGVEARVGRVQCAKYPAIVAHRQRLATIYHEALEDVAQLRLPPRSPGATYSHYAIFCPRAALVIEQLHKAGVQLGDLVEYHIPDLPAYQDAEVVGPRRAAAWPGRMLNLPVHRGVSAADARRIADLVRGALA